MKREEAYSLIRQLINQLEDETVTDIGLPAAYIVNTADPLGIKNVNFSLDCATTTNDEESRKVWKEQRLSRGFDSTELWGLDTTIAAFIKPRLVEFKKENSGYPGKVDSFEEWQEILDKMIYAFDFILEDYENVVIGDDGKFTETEEYKKYKEGMELFCKHFQGLWW